MGRTAGGPECAEWSREVSGESRKQDASARDPQEWELFSVAVETESGACHQRTELKLAALRHLESQSSECGSFVSRTRL